MTHLLRNLVTACIATALLAAPVASATSFSAGVSEQLSGSADLRTPDAHVQAAVTTAASAVASTPIGTAGANTVIEMVAEAPAPNASVETRAQSRAAAYVSGEVAGEGRAEGGAENVARIDEDAKADARSAIAAAADAQVRVEADTSFVGWMKTRVQALFESTLHATVQFAGYVRGEADTRVDDARSEVDHATAIDARGKLEAIVDATVPAPAIHAQLQSTTRAAGSIG